MAEFNLEEWNRMFSPQTQPPINPPAASPGGPLGNFGAELGPRPGGALGGWNGEGAQPAATDPSGQSNWFNSGTIGHIGAGLQGLSSVAGVGLGFMQLADLRKARKQSQANFDRNFAAQQHTVNEGYERRNAARRAAGGKNVYQAKKLA